MTIEFEKWPKIGRWHNVHVIITEKIDGSNACIQFHPREILQDGGLDLPIYEFAAQSRTRIITPEDDNFGFARWVEVNIDTLFADLGYGTHFGEWYGEGIQRRYGLTEKRFALFNAHRWGEKAGHFQTPRVDVVPVLYSGPLDCGIVDFVYAELREQGSRLVPGFANPEGLVIYEVISGSSWKLTDAPAPKPRKDEHGNASA